MINFEYHEGTNALLEIVEPLGIEEIDKYNVRYFSFIKEITNKYSSHQVDKVNSRILEKHFLTKGFTELIIKTTDNCNYRCNYCIYSDHYPFSSNYGTAKMNDETAIKAIEYYLNHIKIQRSYLSDKKAFIAFYGGEPLINFKVIKASIEYVEEHYSDLEVEFTITTNGSLLSDSEISDFLIRHNVIICISLDGYPENHDRNRLQQNGRTTFDELMNVLNSYFRDYPRIYSLCCIDFRTDLLKLYDFYKKNDRLNGGRIPHLLRIAFISDIGTSYYNQFQEDEKLFFYETNAGLRGGLYKSC